MSPPSFLSADRRKLAEMIKDVRVAMMHTFRTPTSSGDLALQNHVRPMYTQKLDPDTFAGELFFFTDVSSAKVQELEQNAAIILTYAAPDKNRFVVVFGTAQCERNVAKASELWNIHAKGWWPEGPTSQALAVVRVQVSSAEFWDGPSKLSYAITLFSAVAKGERIESYGEHGRVG